MRNPAYRSLTDQQLSEIDDLCDRFDRELVNGRGPRIETFLADAPEAAHDGLLAELLAMEIEYRTQQQDDVPQPEDYLLRFPNRQSVIAAVFVGQSKTPLPGNDTISQSGDAVSTTRTFDSPPELDNFHLIEVIGRGGMGVVWRADQIQPVKRRVALKLIKSDLPSREVIARFDAEKQALAMMDHQNIARVFDAGTTQDGRPYFVMELVDGIPITQYCDENKLSVDERLKLFVSVCHAVQHAHQKGIIHRDLKPSNVLITVIDSEAVPKVIDFGLAKAVEQNLQLTDMTMQTEFGKVVGTVQYMSPEQAELKDKDAQDIDTRTDVYSLGVMLYELLTGSTPLDKETLGRNAILKILEMIRQDDPPRPSNRLSSSTNEVNSAVSNLRRLHPARLQQLLRGELDWVVMKALEKDRTRRYQTANDFGQDLTNYLTGAAVSARPASKWYQIQKFARRNRGLVAAMLAIAAVLIGGIAGTSYGLIRAHQKTKLAEEERGKAVDSEQRASVETQRARDSEANAKFQLAVARWEAGRPREARDLHGEIPSDYRDNFEWDFWNRQFDGSDFTCYGHSKSVQAVAFSPDGKQVATASSDESIKLWDANSGQEISTLRGHQGVVDDVVFSPDGTRIASAGSDKAVRIWDARSGKIISTLTGHTNFVDAVAFSPNGEQLVSASWDATVKLWDARSGELIRTHEHPEKVTDVDFSPDGERFVCCNDLEVTFWDVATGRQLERRRDLEWSPKSVAYSPDGMHIASASHDIVTLWDAGLTRKIWTTNAKAGWIADLRFSPDGTRIASTGTTQIRVWDIVTGTEIMTLVGHGDEVKGVAFSPDGARLASASIDRTLKMWDARVGHRPMSIRAHDHIVSGIAFSHDGARLASVGFDSTFNLWDVATGVKIASLKGYFNRWSRGIHSVAFSSNDEYIAFGTADNTVKLLDGRTGAELKSFNGHEGSVCGVAFSPDSKCLVSGGVDQLLKLWDCDSGEEITTFNGHAGQVNCVVFSPDGTRVASASEDSTIKLWDVVSGKEVNSIDEHAGSVINVVFSPDGNQIASSSDDGTIRVWDTRSSKEISRSKGLSGGVIGIVFSPDGKRIASTGRDRALKLWDTQTLQEITTIHANAQFGVAFSPDGSRIAAGTEEGIINFFDAPTEHEVKTLTEHSDTVTQWSFSDNGSKIFSASNDEKLCWDFATKELVPNAAWNPPSSPIEISPDGRWLIAPDRNNILLVDLEYKNTRREKAYRSAKARFDSEWHQDQANQAVASRNWYAAVFQFALLLKNDPDQATYHDSLHSSLQELTSQFEQADLDIEPHLAMVVKESLKLPRGSEWANPSFEEPVVHKESWENRNTMTGWRTTGKKFEIWASGFSGVDSHDGNQFVELNSNEDATLYKDLTGIQRGAVFEFSFAHRGRNGDDTLKLIITDLGADNWPGGGDDKELFAKDYTSGKNAWAVYDSTAEPRIAALGNKVRFAYNAVDATGGKGQDNTEGNFLDSVEFGVGVVTAKSTAFGVKRLQTSQFDGDNSESHFLGMKNDMVGITDETTSNIGSIFVLKVEKKNNFAVLINREGKYVTARSKAVVLTDTLETGSRWVIRNPLKADLDPGNGWFSLESASDPGRFLRHYSMFTYAHKYSELTPDEAARFLSDASWKFVDAQ